LPNAHAAAPKPYLHRYENDICIVMKMIATFSRVTEGSAKWLKRSRVPNFAQRVRR
jgi:hypothetical protein